MCYCCNCCFYCCSWCLLLLLLWPALFLTLNIDGKFLYIYISPLCVSPGITLMHQHHFCYENLSKLLEFNDGKNGSLRGQNRVIFFWTSPFLILFFKAPWMFHQNVFWWFSVFPKKVVHHHWLLLLLFIGIIPPFSRLCKYVNNFSAQSLFIFCTC